MDGRAVCARAGTKCLALSPRLCTWVLALGISAAAPSLGRAASPVLRLFDQVPALIGGRATVDVNGVGRGTFTSGDAVDGVQIGDSVRVVWFPPVTTPTGDVVFVNTAWPNATSTVTFTGGDLEFTWNRTDSLLVLQDQNAQAYDGGFRWTARVPSVAGVDIGDFESGDRMQFPSLTAGEFPGTLSDPDTRWEARIFPSIEKAAGTPHFLFNTAWLSRLEFFVPMNSDATTFLWPRTDGIWTLTRSGADVAGTVSLFTTTAAGSVAVDTYVLGQDRCLLPQTEVAAYPDIDGQYRMTFAPADLAPATGTADAELLETNEFSPDTVDIAGIEHVFGCVPAGGLLELRDQFGDLIPGRGVVTVNGSLRGTFTSGDTIDGLEDGDAVTVDWYPPAQRPDGSEVTFFNHWPSATFSHVFDGSPLLSTWPRAPVALEVLDRGVPYRADMVWEGAHGSAAIGTFVVLGTDPAPVLKLPSVDANELTGTLTASFYRVFVYPGAEKPDGAQVTFRNQWTESTVVFTPDSSVTTTGFEWPRASVRLELVDQDGAPYRAVMVWEGRTGSAPIGTFTVPESAPAPVLKLPSVDAGEVPGTLSPSFYQATIYPGILKPDGTEAAQASDHWPSRIETFSPDTTVMTTGFVWPRSDGLWGLFRDGGATAVDGTISLSVGSGISIGTYSAGTGRCVLPFTEVASIPSIEGGVYRLDVTPADLAPSFGTQTAELLESDVFSPNTVDVAGVEHLFACVPPPCVTRPADLVSWWPGDASAADLAGGNDGVLAGGAGFGPGRVRQAFDFDGAGGHVAIPPHPSLEPDRLTADAWVRVECFPAAGELDGVVSNRDGPADESYVLYLDGDSESVAFAINVDGTAAGRTAALAPWDALLDSRWHHLAGTYDGADVRLHVDGVEVASEPRASPALHHPGNEVHIGRHFDGAASHYFDGSIDEVEVAERALATAEIQALVAAGRAGKCRAACGDGFLDIGEECDDGGTVNGDGCDDECRVEVCGNGFVQEHLGEQCDDGNLADGDGCSSICQYQCVQPAQGLAGWWPLDGIDPMRAIDLAGSHDGVLAVGPVFVAGRVAGALALDGADD